MQPADAPRRLSQVSTSRPGAPGNNSRSGRFYFNRSYFGPEALGQICDANREFFHGPRLDGYDVALLKNFAFSEAKRLQLRIEGFDVFNHAEFANPSGSYTPQQLWRANIDIYFAHWAIEFEVLF